MTPTRSSTPYRYSDFPETYGAPEPALPGTRLGPNVAPSPPPRRRRLGSVALVLALMTGSGAAGAGLVLALQDEQASPAAAPTNVQRGAADSTAPAVSGTTEAAAATIAPSVVTIQVSGTATAATPFGTQRQRVSGTGSGVVLSTDGHIVTNHHVIAAAIGGGSVQVQFTDGTESAATIVGSDPTSDLAVIRVPASGDLVPATFADSDALAVGQSVLAVGAPLGLSNTVTEGIVSTLNRPVRAGQSASEQSVIDAVQTDAAINPGNSGGALVDLAGQVIGINSSIATDGSSSGSIGVGFAIPSNTAAQVADEIIRTGRAEHPLLGVSLSDAGDGSGAIVRQVSQGAAAAGLQPGDVVIRLGDRDVPDADTLIVAVRAQEPGDTVTVTYVRGGAERQAQVVLSTAPAE